MSVSPDGRWLLYSHVASAGSDLMLLDVRLGDGDGLVLLDKLKASHPQLPVIGRMWGIRNLSLAAGMYAATGANRAQWWRLQPAVDALDFLHRTREKLA